MLNNSETLISICPKYIKRIIEKNKNYEFRPFKISNEDEKVIFWVYESKPTMCIKYKLIAKNPIVDMKDGSTYTDGQDEFDRIINKNRVAYEITEVYELVEPITLDELRCEHGLKNAPQNFLYLKNYPTLQEKLKMQKLKKVI